MSQNPAVTNVYRLCQMTGGMTGFAVPDLIELEQGNSMTRLPQQHRSGEARDPASNNRHVHGQV